LTKATAYYLLRCAIFDFFAESTPMFARILTSPAKRELKFPVDHVDKSLFALPSSFLQRRHGVMRLRRQQKF
jgi:hypothetical protein